MSLTEESNFYQIRQKIFQLCNITDQINETNMKQIQQFLDQKIHGLSEAPDVVRTLKKLIENGDLKKVGNGKLDKAKMYGRRSSSSYQNKSGRRRTPARAVRRRSWRQRTSSQAQTGRRRNRNWRKRTPSQTRRRGRSSSGDSQSPSQPQTRRRRRRRSSSGDSESPSQSQASGWKRRRRSRSKRPNSPSHSQTGGGRRRRNRQQQRAPSQTGGRRRRRSGQRSSS